MTAEEFQLRSVPARGAKLEHEGILIEWDYPKPENPVRWRPNTDSWFKRLGPLRATPGRRARVARGIDKTVTARSRVNTIAHALYERDPRSKWKIERGQEDNGTHSIWVTYLGVMSDQEFEEREALRAFRSKRARLGMLKKARRNDLKRSLMNPSLRPPVVRPDD